MAIIDRQTIDDFFKKDKIAVVGASRSEKKYGGMLFKELMKKGIDVIPVNPQADEIQEKKAYATLKAIPDTIDVDSAIIVVPAEAQADAVLDAADAGFKTVWLHEHVMKGVSNPKAIYLAEDKGLTCITGYCPFMFIPGSGFPHNAHKFIMKLFGALPKDRQK